MTFMDFAQTLSKVLQNAWICSNSHVYYLKSSYFIYAYFDNSYIDL
jgi:hypothetical protein